MINRAGFTFRRSLLGIALCSMRLQAGLRKWRSKWRKPPRRSEPTWEEVLTRLQAEGWDCHILFFDDERLRCRAVRVMVRERIEEMSKAGLTTIVYRLRLPYKGGALGYSLVYFGGLLSFQGVWKTEGAWCAGKRRLRIFPLRGGDCLHLPPVEF